MQPSTPSSATFPTKTRQVCPLVYTILFASILHTLYNKNEILRRARPIMALPFKKRESLQACFLLHGQHLKHNMLLSFLSGRLLLPFLIPYPSSYRLLPSLSPIYATFMAPFVSLVPYNYKIYSIIIMLHCTAHNPTSLPREGSGGVGPLP